MGTELRLLGPPDARSYDHLLLMSVSRAGITFNYHMGEYLYKIEQPELINELLSRNGAGKMYDNGLKPVVREGMNSSEGNYSVYSDSPSLDVLNIVCSHQRSVQDIADSDSTKIDTQIVSLADTVIIILNGNCSAYPLAQLLSCCWERWNYSMNQHVIFVISKSDRFDTEEITEIKDQYVQKLKNLLAKITASDDENAQKLTPSFLFYPRR